MKSGVSRAQENRRIRQDAMREKLEAMGLAQHVIEIAMRLANFDEVLDAVQVQRLKAAADLQMKLVGKYLPDLKHVEAEVTNANDNASLEELIEQLANVRNRLGEAGIGPVGKDRTDEGEATTH